MCLVRHVARTRGLAVVNRIKKGGGGISRISELQSASEEKST